MYVYGGTPIWFLLILVQNTWYYFIYYIYYLISGKKEEGHELFDEGMCEWYDVEKMNVIYTN